jgi:hypothetical protein
LKLMATSRPIGYRVSSRPAPPDVWRVATLILATLACAVTAGSASAVADSCSNGQLRLEDRSSELPDCRAYEQVSPVYKAGYAPAIAGAADGSRVLMESLGRFAGAEGNFGVEGSDYESMRTGSGWVTKALNPSASLFPMANYTDTSADLRRTLWVAHTTTQSIDENDLYLREPGGSFVLIGPELPSSAFTGPPGPERGDPGNIKYVGAASDLSRVLFMVDPTELGTESNSWPGDTTLARVGRSALYEYAGTGNSEPTLVAVRNEGRPRTNQEAQPITQCGAGLGAYTFEEGIEIVGSMYNAVSSSSTDNSGTVFFTANAGGCGRIGSQGVGPSVYELYLRRDESRTVAISEPSLSVPGRECTNVCKEDENEENGHKRSPGTFRGASQDGSKVFFTTKQPLLNSAVAGSGEGLDLYEAQIERGGEAKVTRLVQVSHSPTAEPASVLGVARISEDGSHVYFVATGVLTPDANGKGEVAVSGAANLYVFNTATNVASFVASLSGEDSEDWQTPDSRPVQATPDGRFLVFSSHADLTPDDKSGVSQIFEYDALTGKLVRVSVGQKAASGFLCPATEQVEEGYNCNGNTMTPEYAPEINSPSFSISDIATQAASQLSISSDGATIVFASANALAPQAINSLAGLCTNVYEYRSSGGNIDSGNVFLVSDGHDVSRSRRECGSRFYNMDPSASDIFFVSTDQLVAQDTDTQRDVYDARVGGGFPAPSVPPACEGEGCQGATAAPRVFGAPSSATFNAPGNLTPPTPVPVKPKTAAQVRAQKLAKALKACRTKHNRQRRKACERQARKRYGSTKAKKASHTTTTRKGG